MSDERTDRLQEMRDRSNKRKKEQAQSLFDLGEALVNEEITMGDFREKVIWVLNR